MDGRVAACFLVFLALLLPDDVACEDNPELPDYLYAWKFEEDANGFCRFEHYKISTKHGLERKEPLRNYVPIASFPSNCYDGHSKMGLNLIETAAGNYAFAACFFYADQKQRLVCQYLDKNVGFVNFVDAQCNDEKLLSSGLNHYFIIGAILSGKEANFVEYCVDSHCCRVNHDKSVEYYDGRTLLNRFDAVLGILGGYEFDSKLSLSDQFNSKGFYHFEHSDLMSAYRGVRSYLFAKRFDYYHVGHDKIQVPDETAVSFLGFKYSEHRGECALVAERAGTEFNKEMKMYCQDNLIGEGYNVEWNMAEQTAYLKGCFVSLHHRNEPRLVCYLFKNGTGQSSPVVDYYFTGDCKNLLSIFKPINVIVGTGPDNFVAVETPSKHCKVKISADGKVSEKFNNRPYFGHGYDPYNEKAIDRKAAEAINGKAIDAPETAGLHSIGNHLLVRVDDSKWLVVKDGKTETKNWKYAYVMEEAAARTFL